ncbi:MAG: amino acid-binding protein [Candidatus Helarchaeota archaeon]|nr:amino acid-binding protein [Candidatus Helarchaeota archaeon]
MWNEIQKIFRKNPKKLEVARTILELGLCISTDKKVFCGDIEIPYSKIAKALNIDRRVVISTVELILDHKKLKKIFTKIKPAGPSFMELAKQVEFEFGLVEISAESETVGIIARVTDLIAKEGVSIRQIFAQDPELFPDPKLIIITEKPITDITKKFLEIPGILSVSIF